MHDRTWESPCSERARGGLSPLWAVVLMLACDRPESAATRAPETESAQPADGGLSSGSAESQPAVAPAGDAAGPDAGGEEPTEASAGEDAGEDAAPTEPCVAEPIPEEVAAILGPIEGLEFDFNKWTIRPTSFPLLDRIVEVLKRYPEVAIEIQGHRDDDPHWRERAVDITQKRADAVRRYLLEQGILAERLVSRGYGPDRPIVPNDSAEHRAQNRRIELHGLETMSSPPSCADGPGA